jgi:hypothetical protein
MALVGLLVATAAPASATTWNDPVLVSSTQAHRETSLALSPVDDSRFVCDPSGVPAVGTNQSYFHVSHDGGASWAPIDVEGGQTDLRNNTYEGGDCDVAYDAAGTMYSADTWLGSLSVGHSTDGGKTWDGTPVAATVPVVDRPWLVGGPPGVVHFTYQALQCCMPSAIWYTHATDYGKTFAPAVPVAQAGLDGAFTWEGNLVVAPNQQDLYLVYNRRQNGLVDVATTAETVWVAASHDAGLTWTSHQVATLTAPASYLYPSLAMDGKGNLHVVYSSPTDVDQPIWLTSSTDKGLTWSAPRALLRGSAGFSPWVEADAAGHVAVAWYGSPDVKAATPSKTTPWYFYWAKVDGATTSAPAITAGRTTTQPIFTGQSPIPEFEEVRLDRDGLMHLGMSAYFKPKTGNPKWAIYYQTEAAE